MTKDWQEIFSPQKQNFWLRNVKKEIAGATKFYCLIPGNAMVGFPAPYFFLLCSMFIRVSIHTVSRRLFKSFANNPFPPTLGKQWYFSSTSHGIGAKNLLKKKAEEEKSHKILTFSSTIFSSFCWRFLKGGKGKTLF